MKYISILLLMFFLTGCVAGNQRVLDSSASQLETRSYQSRVFDTNSQEMVMRATLSTLQDLGFVIERADAVLGTVTALKLDGYQIRITVSLRPRGETQTLVRANAQFNVTPIQDPKHYQDFFTSLEKSLFLTANAVD